VHHWRAVRAESDRSTRGAVNVVLGSGAGEVHVVREGQEGELKQADVPQSGRVFRVVVCEFCHWQYGAWWVRVEVYGYWGDCPHCGRPTAVATAYRFSVPGSSVSSTKSRAASGYQQELAL